MKGTLTFSYRIPAEQVATAIEVAPHSFSAGQDSLGTTFSVWYGYPVTSEMNYQARSELEDAFTAAGIEFEYAAYGVKVGDSLPWWRVKMGELDDGVQIRAWSAEEAIEQVRGILPIPEDAYLIAEQVEPLD